MALTSRDRVRLEIGDTDSTDALFSDTEIDAYLSDHADWHLAAADCLNALANRFSRFIDFESDQQKFTRLARVAEYREQAKLLRARTQGVTAKTSTRKDGYSQDVTNDDATSSASTSNSGRVRSGYYTDDRPY